MPQYLSQFRGEYPSTPHLHSVISFPPLSLQRSTVDCMFMLKLGSRAGLNPGLPSGKPSSQSKKNSAPTHPLGPKIIATTRTHGKR